MAEQEKSRSFVSMLLRGVGALCLAAVATLFIFFFLPLLQAIESALEPDLNVIPVNTQIDPPPPPPEEPEQEEEEPEPEPPPELEQEAPPLDLNQLELALNPGTGAASVGDVVSDFVRQLGAGSNDSAVDEIFSFGDLDQKPRAVYQKPPNYPAELRKQGGTVFITFLVDANGRVVNPKVDQSNNPRLNPFALQAIREWRFEPGQIKGKKVPYKMRIPITFDAAG